MSAKADIPIEVLHQPHETPACSRKFTQRGRQLRARHRASSNSFHDYHASGAAPARKSGIMACLTVRHRHRRNKSLISRRNPGRISGFHPPEPTQVGVGQRPEWGMFGQWRRLRNSDSVLIASALMQLGEGGRPETIWIPSAPSSARMRDSTRPARVMTRWPARNGIA
jgi:hypothetical protein